MQRTVSLTCHPAAVSSAVHGIGARVSVSPDGALSLSFIVEGDLSQLRIPEPRAQRFADKLWQHTCFELFAKREGDDAYREFNFSPSGEWAAYAFERYREGMTRIDSSAPQIAVRSGAGKLDVDIVVRPDDALLRDHAALALGLSAVIEDADGALSYWALAHPTAKPDFHHPGAFTLEVGRRFSRSGSDPGLDSTQ